MEDIKKEAQESETLDNNELLSDGAVETKTDSTLEQLKECEQKYVRMLAEYDNFRKRSKKESETVYTSAFAQGIVTLLPVLDNIARAVLEECTDEKYKEGILLIDKQIKDIYQKHGILEFGAAGDGSVSTRLC